ncbi:hypothetical protein F4553_006975 [Allocatelliglobosispora scoriae]|uniref:Uncharacterized protein n=1 Tax=Allocatelliglobosispora scoriae TaxID=643052 RepID=A0A841C3Y7_9ACTN|nr:hypothetical protein [Allocatelliglobosispora scoriae]MBB5873541.1 hypothetical protein [Allocatelliglobosispora scoriae]
MPTHVESRGPNEAKSPYLGGRTGLIAGYIEYVMQAGFVLASLAVIGFTFVAFDEPIAEGWGFLVFGFLLLAIFVPLGIVFARDTTLTRQRWRRLDTVGVPAIAEILEITTIILDETDGTRLRLRISGPGFTPFEASLECEYRRPMLQVGDRLNAVVDPSDQLFAVLAAPRPRG